MNGNILKSVQKFLTFPLTSFWETNFLAKMVSNSRPPSFWMHDLVFSAWFFEYASSFLVLQEIKFGRFLGKYRCWRAASSLLWFIHTLVDSLAYAQLLHIIFRWLQLGGRRENAEAGLGGSLWPMLNDDSAHPSAERWKKRPSLLPSPGTWKIHVSNTVLGSGYFSRLISLGEIIC